MLDKPLLKLYNKVEVFIYMLFVTGANLTINEKYSDSLNELFKHFKRANKQLFLVTFFIF